MTLATLVNIASLVSSVAVLMSVAYLALQTRQTARNQRAIMDRARCGFRAWAALRDRFPEPFRGFADTAFAAPG